MMLSGGYNMYEMKLSEMDEWMIGLDVEESGVYGIKLDDDCNVVECVKMDEVKERVEKYREENFEFWVGNDYEYWNIGVEK
mgnify:CR=1 FL=1